MKNEKDILAVLKKYARGACLHEEEEHIRKWLYENMADSLYDSLFEDFLDFCNPEADAEKLKRAYLRVEDRILSIEGMSRRSRKSGLRISLRASFLAASIIAIFSIFLTGPDRFVSPEQDFSVPETNMLTFCTPVGSNAVLRLSDGTEINVNSRTSVIYPESFAEGERRIRVEGEAYFNVAHDPDRPFIVETDYFDIKVYGTEFNVNTFNQENSPANVVLVDGSVEVSTDSESFFIEPGMMVFAEDDGLGTKDVNIEDYVSWKDGYLILSGMNMNQIAEKLSSYYGINVSFVGKSLNFYGKLDLKDNFLEMMENIGRIIPIKVVRTNDGYRITTIN